MIDSKENLPINREKNETLAIKTSTETFSSKEKGPLSFLSGALTSGLLAVLCLRLSQFMVEYFTLHSPHYSSPMAQSISSAFKTLIIGMCFLATFSFAFIGLGLGLVFLRSLLVAKEVDHD